MHLKKTVIMIALSLLTLTGFYAPRIIKAQDQDLKTVKVGWYESSYN